MEENQEKNSALNISKGIHQPESINPSALNNLKKKKRNIPSSAELIEGIKLGNRSLLGQAITLIESSLPGHQEMARGIIEKCLPMSGNSTRIGITGVPGVGKSTFIESIGKYITSRGKKLAVLAVDPSSERSKGSILGDKTRMEELSSIENAFIRPSPSAGSLGGVARKTREAIILCEAAGFDTIFVETVGVGQSETAVHSMVDFFLLLMLAGAGDELQGIKRGIMEMADAIVITKADGSNVTKAERAKAEYANALHLFPPTPSGWIPRVLTCSSLTNTGIASTWETIMEYVHFSRGNKFFSKRRREQSAYWMYSTIEDTLKDQFYQNPALAREIKQKEKEVTENKISSFSAARQLMEMYSKLLNKDN
jgi:LAO/AO transport system kinase